MRVAVLHNHYRTSAPSGEDVVVDNECRMLTAYGVDVQRLERFNDDIDADKPTAKVRLAVNTVWSAASHRATEQFLREVRPDVVHVHNTFPQLSPSIYSACKSQGLPVVQTLHNFRFFCPGGLFLRDNKPCEACIDKNLWQSIKYRCYRNSVTATATLATMLAVHRRLGTYAHAVDRYITLTQFAQRKAIAGGLPAQKVIVKPNFLSGEVPEMGRGAGGYALFVGRLLEGKGAQTLVDAWRYLPEVPLKIIGDGALRGSLHGTVRQNGSRKVEFTGSMPRDRVLELMQDAAAVIVPSDCYEGFPLVVAEAFACGAPVIASRLGSLDELVEEGVTGLKFTPGDARDLARAVKALQADSAHYSSIRTNARKYFEDHLTEAQNYHRLMAIYEDVVAGNQRAGS